MAQSGSDKKGGLGCLGALGVCAGVAIMLGACLRGGFLVAALIVAAVCLVVVLAVVLHR